MSTLTSKAASVLGKKRWAGKSKAQRSAHAKAMSDRRSELIAAGRKAEKQAGK
jgi:hypothetical protein